MVLGGPESRATRLKTRRFEVCEARILNKLNAFVELMNWLRNYEVRTVWGTMAAARVTIQ